LQDKQDETKLQGILIKKTRASSDLEKDIDRAHKFSAELSKETDETAFLAKINEDDVKKSSIFYLDEL